MPNFSFRLPRRDFGEVFKRGFGISGPNISIRMNANGRSFCRLGYTVGMSFSKSAVRRNRARRMLREAMRPLIPLLKPGYDLVFGYRRGINEEPKLQEIRRELDTLLRKKHHINQ